MSKTVLITGAAHGLGRALAGQFLQSGWQVIATDVDELPMAWMLNHKESVVLKMDVTSGESVANVFNKLQERQITIDLIINNAGIDRYFPLSEAPVEAFRNIFEVNVFGGYRVNQVFLQLLRKPGGRIIHIGSESLHITGPFMPYPLTKKLVEGYARSLRIELKFLGVDVVVIRPGAISTRLIGDVERISPATQIQELKRPFERFASMAYKEIGKTITPEEAAAYIYKVALIPKPGAVYTINNMLQLKIAALLPFRWIEKLLYNRLR